MKKKRIVLDSSVIVKFIFSEGEDGLRQADALLSDVENGTVTLVAPVLAKYEIGNVIRFRKITEPEKVASWNNFEQLPIKYFDLSFPDGSRSEEVAERAKITFYDAVFIVLAEKLEATLVTANSKHQRQFPNVKIINLKDYRFPRAKL